MDDQPNRDAQSYPYPFEAGVPPVVYRAWTLQATPHRVLLRTPLHGSMIWRAPDQSAHCDRPHTTPPPHEEHGCGLYGYHSLHEAFPQTRHQTIAVTRTARSGQLRVVRVEADVIGVAVVPVTCGALTVEGPGLRAGSLRVCALADNGGLESQPLADFLAGAQPFSLTDRWGHSILTRDPRQYLADQGGIANLGEFGQPLLQRLRRGAWAAVPVVPIAALASFGATVGQPYPLVTALLVEADGDPARIDAADRREVIPYLAEGLALTFAPGRAAAIGLLDSIAHDSDPTLVAKLAVSFDPVLAIDHPDVRALALRLVGEFACHRSIVVRAVTPRLVHQLVRLGTPAARLCLLRVLAAFANEQSAPVRVAILPQLRGLLAIDNAVVRESVRTILSSFRQDHRPEVVATLADLDRGISGPHADLWRATGRGGDGPGPLQAL